jgi:hypothetical protein
LPDKKKKTKSKVNEATENKKNKTSKCYPARKKKKENPQETLAAAAAASARTDSVLAPDSRPPLVARRALQPDRCAARFRTALRVSRLPTQAPA